jgi:hypothetical protein
MFIGWMDSRPNWDDTGITVFAILIATFILGLSSPKRAWAWALAVGIWTPIFELTPHPNYGSLAAIPFAFVGAYAGVLVRKAFSPPTEAQKTV